jgi:hypothetical protein
MNYTLKLCNYVSRSPYTYYVVHSDHELTHFEVWSYKKAFNSMLYSEEDVINKINEKYPGAKRVDRLPSKQYSQYEQFPQLFKL